MSHTRVVHDVVRADDAVEGVEVPVLERLEDGPHGCHVVFAVSHAREDLSGRPVEPRWEYLFRYVSFGLA